MENAKNIISLKDCSAEKCHLGGGKFLGLAQIYPLISEYQKKYGLDIEIPQTFAISTNVFQKNFSQKENIPAELLNQAMQCLVACGGNVAVRSSANIEDAFGKTHSGEFASALNVKNRHQMQEALAIVYASAQNIPQSKMGVVIQPMIEQPQVAGVIYSQDFNGDPLVTINWTQGKTADMLLVNKEKGNLTKIGKYLDNRKGRLSLLQFSDLDNRKNKRSVLHSVFGDKLMGSIYLNSFKKEFKYIPRLVALSNHLEKDLGYPVDLEFAISKNGKINILQQRPYIMDSNYIVKQYSNGDWVGYNKNHPVVSGEIAIVDYDSEEEFEKYKTDVKEGKFKDKILLSKYKNFHGFNILAYADEERNVLQSKLKIDASYNLHTELYGHYGNLFRERGTPFLSTQRSNEFKKLKNGDWIEIDLKTGNFTQQTHGKILNSEKMLKNFKPNER